MKNEFQHLTKLDSEHIIKVYELIIDHIEGTMYLIMECFEGKELFVLLSEIGHYDENMAKMLFRQLLLGILYLHKNGIIHRDLKPNNILVSTNNQNYNSNSNDGTLNKRESSVFVNGQELILKITDFNVAKFVDKYNFYDIFKQDNFEMNTYTGTIAFKAPESFLLNKYTLVKKRVC